MDQLVINKAQTILDEWRQAKLEFIKKEKENETGVHWLRKELPEETIKIDKQIVDILAALELFFEMISSCTFTTGKPRVNKIRASAGYHWAFEHNKLFVVPTVIANYGKLGKISINDVTEFNRFNNKNKPVIPYIHVPSESILHYMIGQLVINYNDRTHINRFIDLVHEAFGSRLDELNTQLTSLRYEIGSRLDELTNSRIDKTKNKEANKFQSKLVKFLKGNPKVAEIDPDLIMTCFHMDPNTLKAMRQFIYVNRHDLAFISTDDIVTAQNLAKIGQVHDS